MKIGLATPKHAREPVPSSYFGRSLRSAACELVKKGLVTRAGLIAGRHHAKAVKSTGGRGRGNPDAWTEGLGVAEPFPQLGEFVWF